MRRRALLATLSGAATTAVAGCSALSARGSGTTEKPAFREPTTVDGSNRARRDVERPSADQTVVLANRDDDPHWVWLSVVERKSGLERYETRRELEPASETPVYPIVDADPEGVQSYRCTLELDDRTTSTVLWTNSCHGDVTLVVEADGTLAGDVETCRERRDR